VTFYSNYMKMYEHFALNFGDKRTGCCVTTTHCLTLPFSPGNFWPETTWLPSSTHSARLIWPPATFLCFADWS
jgi:hypothetical protein